MDEHRHLRSETPGRALLVTLWAFLVFFLNLFTWVVRRFERYVFRQPKVQAPCSDPVQATSEASASSTQGERCVTCTAAPEHIGVPSDTLRSLSQSDPGPRSATYSVRERKGTKFYAVKRGYRRGIYTSWSECEEMVGGYSGAVYKSFRTRDEAERFLNQPQSSRLQ